MWQLRGKWSVLVVGVPVARRLLFTVNLFSTGASQAYVREEFV